MIPSVASPFHLRGQSILVTGASSGIGAEVARMAAEHGASVVATGRDEGRLQSVIMELCGEGHQALPADLTQAAARRKLVEAAGPLNGVVHCAGKSAVAPAKFWTEKSWRHLNAINHEAPLLLTRELLAAKSLVGGGSLVFLSSVAAHVPSVGVGLYAATKAALQAAAAVLALELAPRGIRVNCISPGLVETPMMEEESAFPTKLLNAYRERYPLGTGRPDDVAAAVIFLLSPASRWMTGANLLLEGGICLT